jgi:Ca2+:H+ antiporter
MDLHLWLGAVVMVLVATLTATLVTNGRSAWFVGVLVPTLYLIFAMTLYLMLPHV